jgi:hypothetical protein
MPKTCQHESCTYNVFSGGFCRNHQWCRTDKKTKALTRTPIRKVSKKQNTSTVRRERLNQSEKDWEFYLSIWTEREHVCFESGQHLGSEPLTVFCHHVLPKSIKRFKKYRYSPWNIVLLTWANHTQAETLVKFVPKVKAYYDYLIKHLDEIDAGTFTPMMESFGYMTYGQEYIRQAA